ncbi:hypothetical protein RN347_15170 [Halomonas sp. PAMB 3264]|nr:hypothetical protein [Halomonas sp. PAMB 3264]WNL41947.1 hypothetical protein RN347_15170 [Halomonas sp. PAMB 3264]
MSELDYSTINRTPLNQLHTLPLHLLCAYLMQCPQVSRQALVRVIRINQG